MTDKRPLRITQRMATRSVAGAEAVSWPAEAAEADWDGVYREQMPRVYNYLRYRLGPGEAEDLTSVTFLKAWRGRHRYRSDLSSFATWLFAIARNVARDHLRQRRSRGTVVPLDEAEHVAGGEAADREAERRSNAARLAALLAELGERERDVISLKYGADCTHAEIARLTGLSESNVGTILHRAVGRLREKWGEE